MADMTFDRLATIKERLFEAAYDDGQWGEALGELRSALSGSSVAFGYWGAVSPGQGLLYSDCPPEFAERFFDPALRNPFVRGSSTTPEGTILTDTALMPQDEFRRTPIYNEWLAPQGEHSYLQCKLMNDGDVVAHFGILRGGQQDAFGAAELALVNHLAPVLSRVAKLQRRFGSLRLAEEATTYGRLDVGFALVSPTGRVLHHNERMEAIFASPAAGLTLARGMISVSGQVLRGQSLHGLVADACRTSAGACGGDMVIASAETGLPSLGVTVTPVRDAGQYGLAAARAAVVLVQVLSTPLPARLEERIANMFGLTRMEASLAIALASGRSLSDIAEDRSVSMTTVRTQLNRVFRKTMTSQQSHLVALVLSIRPLCRNI